MLECNQTYLGIKLVLATPFLFIFQPKNQPA